MTDTVNAESRFILANLGEEKIKAQKILPIVEIVSNENFGLVLPFGLASTANNTYAT